VADAGTARLDTPAVRPAWRAWGSVPRIKLNRALAIAPCALLIACASHVAPVKDPALLKELGFLHPGSTSREEVRTRLGSAVRSYESGRIVSYAVYKTADGRLSVSASSAVMAPGELSGGERFSLILVFTPDGILDRQSLVGKHE
jgi:hypothetical protein